MDLKYLLNIYLLGKVYHIKNNKTQSFTMGSRIKVLLSVMKARRCRQGMRHDQFSQINSRRSMRKFNSVYNGVFSICGKINTFLSTQEAIIEVYFHLFFFLIWNFSFTFRIRYHGYAYSGLTQSCIFIKVWFAMMWRYLFYLNWRNFGCSFHLFMCKKNHHLRYISVTNVLNWTDITGEIFFDVWASASNLSISGFSSRTLCTITVVCPHLIQRNVYRCTSNQASNGLLWLSSVKVNFSEVFIAVPWNRAMVVFWYCKGFSLEDEIFKQKFWW